MEQRVPPCTPEMPWMPTEGDRFQQSFVSRFGQAALQEAAKAMDAKWQQLEDRVAKQAGRVLQYFRRGGGVLRTFAFLERVYLDKRAIESF